MQVSRNNIESNFLLEIDTPSGYKVVPVTFPGSVHTDLMAIDFIKDIRIDGTEVEQEWIRNSKARYSGIININNLRRTNEFHFEGLDTLATVSINDEVLLKSENMHRQYRVSIPNDLSRVLLQIDFDAPYPEALKREIEMGKYPNPYNMPYNYFRKMACSYGWDWGPVTITSGVWKPIILASWDVGILDEVRIIPSAPDLKAVLKVATKGRGIATAIRIEIRKGQKLVKELSALLGEDKSFSLPELDLWHPRGFGEPALYEVSVLLIHKNEIIDNHVKKVGFRKVSIDRSTIANREKFAICVNDKRVWCKGVNWIPDDPFPHRITKQDYQNKLRDMFSVEVNAIRVWGGGIYESDDFYDVCDQLGIIVWQDFLFACASYPETPKMFEEVQAEATDAINRLASHPSLVFWCGGNENIEGFQHWGWPDPLAGKSWGLTFYTDLLPKVLADLDGTRPYIPSSPFSFLVDDVKDFSSGTNHIWDVWNERGYQRYEDYSPSFAAEFGYNGPGSWLTLTKSINKKTLDSTDKDLAGHQKAFDGMDKLAAGLKREFEKELVAGPDWYFAAQLVQARAVEVGLKHFRSQYESCSGTMLWQYNDMWPAISWSVVDSSGARKLSWFAMREAYRPRFLHFSGVDRGLIIINDSDEIWQENLNVHLVDPMGENLESNQQKIEIAARDQLSFDLSSLFNTRHIKDIDGFLIAQIGTIRVSRRISNNPIIKINAADFDLSTQVKNGNLSVLITAHKFLTEFCLLPELLAKSKTVVSEQLVTLFPNESKIIEIEFESDQDLTRVKSNLEEVCFSLNRMIN